MADEFNANAYAPIVVIPGTPPDCRPQLPQFELNDDPSQAQDWTTSPGFYNKDTLRLQISYQNHPAQSSSYLSSPVSPSPYLSSPVSSTSSALSMSPGGLAAVFGDFTIVDETSPEDSSPWNLEHNVFRGQSSLSSDGSTPSGGLNLTIPAANDQFINAYSLSTTPEEDYNDIFSQTICVNFEESSNIVDHDPSPSQSDVVSYLPPQHSESTSSFFIPHSPVPSVPRADLLPTTSKVDEGALQGHHHPSREVPRSSLLPFDGHEDDRQLNHHNRSHSNPCMSSGVGGPFSSSLLTPNIMVPESNGQPLQRRHSHSSGSQKAMETQGQPRRAKSVHNRYPYARPQVTGPADAYPTPNSVDHRKFCDTRTPEQSAPPSPLPPSSSHSRNVQQSPEDMFRRYDNASAIGYPILQRDTIASDAVLQASAKRRKKNAAYQCLTCGQMLTSRDNLNNHMDAHTGVRRHQCEYCHERFRTRSVLKRHQKSLKCPGSRASSMPDREAKVLSQVSPH